MRVPRFVHRLYAWAFGYFWLPCPVCGRPFGGHQARWPCAGLSDSRVVCPDCGDAAAARHG